MKPRSKKGKTTRSKTEKSAPPPCEWTAQLKKIKVQRQSIREAFTGTCYQQSPELIENFILEAECLYKQIVSQEKRPPAQIAKSLKVVAQKAHALFNTLTLLEGDAMRRFRAAIPLDRGATFLSAYIGEGEDNRLAKHLQSIVLIRDAAKQAAAGVPKNRGTRSVDLRAEQIVQCLRLAWKVTWGEFPSTSRGSDFERVAQAVGKIFNVPIGRAALKVRGGINSLAR